jgi:hypothetical protein
MIVSKIKLRLVVIAFIFLIAVINIHFVSGQNKIIISDRDKAEILKIVLYRILLPNNEGEAGISKAESNLSDPCSINPNKRTELILSENIEKELLPKIDCIEFQLIDQKYIRNQSIYGITYIAVGQFEFKDERVIVTVSRLYAEMLLFGRNGFTIEFVKENGIWNGKVISTHHGMS